MNIGLNISRNQPLKKEHYNLILSSLTRIISDWSSHLKSTKEDSKNETVRLPLLAIVRLLQLCFNIRNVITTMQQHCSNSLTPTDKFCLIN